jgi:K+-sensing histidine kinase KdpD
MNPSHQRTNPQRAIEEYARTTNVERVTAGQQNASKWGSVYRAESAEDHYNTRKRPSSPLIKLGQGRRNNNKANELSAYLVMGLAVIMLALFIGLCFGLPR